MTPRLMAATVLVLSLLAVSPAWACRWFGTQLVCDVGPSWLVVGTQAAIQPTWATPFPTNAYTRNGGLPDGAASPRFPLVIELQHASMNPANCTEIGNETYCY
jgi:hypothetical protein